MLKKILCVLLGLIGLVAVVNYAAFSPDMECRAELTTEVEPARLLAVAQDLRTWEDWSPWSKSKSGDESVQFTFEGEPGSGMKWNWADGKELGTGTMTITRVAADALDYHIEMTAPMKMAMDGGVTFAPGEGGTAMTWWSKSHNDFPLIGRMMSQMMKGSIEADFLQALEGLAAHAKQGS